MVIHCESVSFYWLRFIVFCNTLPLQKCEITTEIHPTVESGKWNLFLCSRLIIFKTVVFHCTLSIWISQNLLINSKIWLIQIAKKTLLWISQILLLISAKINCFISGKYFSLIRTVKINWFKIENIFSLVNQWKGKSLIQSVKIWLIRIYRVNKWLFTDFRFRAFRNTLPLQNCGITTEIHPTVESGKLNLFLCGRLVIFETVVFHCILSIWISQNLLIISKIWLIQIAKKKLLVISQILLLTSTKINWFIGEKYFSLIWTVKINWFKIENIFY